jgi:biopolymer transport protein ExbD
MIDEIFQKPRKKHTKDLNIVPILDMLVTVIFFLLMSTSFIEYTKLSLPPASSVAVSTGGDHPPISPKIYVSQSNDQYTLQLKWAGKAPGVASRSADAKTIESKTRELMLDFSKAYPGEKTLQVSMKKSVNYQSLISLMDGARDYLPDIVLTSYTNAEAEAP